MFSHKQMTPATPTLSLFLLTRLSDSEVNFGRNQLEVLGKHKSELLCALISHRGKLLHVSFNGLSQMSSLWVGPW